MDRRDFLKAGTALGVAGATGLEACVTVGTGADTLHAATAASIPRQADMHAFVNGIDHVLGMIDGAGFLRDVIRANQPALATSEVDDRDALARAAMRSLMVAGSFSDLHPDDQAHPAMQERIWNSLADMNDAAFGVAHAMKSMSTEHRRAVRTHLAGDTTVLPRIADALDAAAGQAGATMKRRNHLRKLIEHVGWRLTQQDPGIVFDEYTTALDKTVARLKSAKQSEVPSQPSSSSGEASPVTSVPPMQISTGAQPTYVPPSYAPQQPGMMPPPPPMMVAAAPRRNSGPAILMAGGITLGIGAVIAGVGVGLAFVPSVSFLGMILITVGAIGFITGIILLIVGAVVNANQRAELQAGPRA